MSGRHPRFFACVGRGIRPLSDGLRFYILEQQADVLDMMAERPRQARVIGSLCALAERSADRRCLAMALNREADLVRVTAQPQRALDLAEQSMAVCERLGDETLLVNALRQRGMALKELNRFDEALAAMERGLELAEIGGRPAQTASLINCLGSVANARGDHKQALAYYDRATQIYRALGDRHAATQQLQNAALAQLQLGSYDAAEQQLQTVVRESREMGDTVAMAAALLNLAGIHFYRGQLLRAKETLDQCLAWVRRLNNLKWEYWVIANQGELHFKMGQLEPALEFFRRGRTLALQLGDEVSVAQETANIGKCAALLGRRAEALPLVESALDAMNRFGIKDYIPYYQVMLANYHREDDRLDRAEELAAAALANSDEAELTSVSIQAMAMLAQIKAARGLRQEALQHADRALSLLDQFGHAEGNEIEILYGLYTVYHQFGEHGKTGQCLARVHQLMQGRIAQLADDRAREAFLGLTPFREIAAAWDRRPEGRE